MKIEGLPLRRHQTNSGASGGGLVEDSVMQTSMM